MNRCLVTSLMGLKLDHANSVPTSKAQFSLQTETKVLEAATTLREQQKDFHYKCYQRVGNSVEEGLAI